jgi:hypothetical protein
MSVNVNSKDLIASHPCFSFRTRSLQLRCPTYLLTSHRQTHLGGGWWSRPSSWKSNTAVVATAVAFSVYGIWQFSAAREVRWRLVFPRSWMQGIQL